MDVIKRDRAESGFYVRERRNTLFVWIEDGCDKKGQSREWILCQRKKLCFFFF